MIKTYLSTVIKNRKTQQLLIVLLLGVVIIASTSSLYAILNPSTSGDLQITSNYRNAGSPSISNDDQGNIYLVWHDNVSSEGIYQIYFNKLSGDRFINYHPDIQVSQSPTGAMYPSIAYDPSGYLHVVWQDNRDGNWEIYYRKLLTNGTMLTDEERVTSDPGNSLHPDITVDDVGDVQITWYDDRTGDYEIYRDKRVEPDLVPVNMTVDIKKPLEGQIVLINVTVKNQGDNIASNAVVVFLVDDVPVDNETVTLAAHTEQDITFSWRVKYGTHVLSIQVDPLNHISESVESNNIIGFYLHGYAMSHFTNTTISTSATIKHRHPIEINMQLVCDPMGSGTPNSIKKFVCFTSTRSFEYAMIKIGYNHSQLGSISESSLRMYAWDPYDAQGGHWILLPESGVNTVEDYVWANVTHFTIFALIGNTTQNLIPVGLWHFDEGSGIIAYDATSNHNDGIIQGATWTTGHNGNALYFHGGGQWTDGDVVTVPHSSSIDITSPFGVEAWINAIGSDDYLAIVDKYQYTSGGSRGFTLYLSGGKLRLSIYSGVSGSVDVFGTSDLRNKGWRYVKGVWNGTHAQVYVNDTCEGSVVWSHPPASTTQNLGIGKRISGWGGYLPFYGILDEVCLSVITTQPNPPKQPCDVTIRHTHPSDKYKGINLTQYTYNTSSTAGNNLYFKFFWGDGSDSGWIGPYASGQSVSASHAWVKNGYYNISAIVKIGVEGTPSNPSTARIIRIYRVGDTNADNKVDFGDINPFVLLLTSGKTGYYNVHSNGYYYTGDCNRDSQVDFGDINPFVKLLV